MAIKKEFLPYDTIRDNGFILAKQIADQAFIPDVLYVALRGGVYLANVIHEYLSVIQQKPIIYAAVVAHSYYGVGQAHAMKVEGWTYDPSQLSAKSKVLLVDDIFDSGATINYLVDILLKQGLSRQNIKIAVHDYKVFEHTKNLPIHPDYWCRKHVVTSDAQNIWFHYMSHELTGLSEDEVQQFYVSANEQLRDVLVPITKR